MNSASAAVAPSVLVVDDEPVLSGTVKNYLERAGMSAQTCGDGLVALDLVRATAPDVVVLDLGLPGMDGVEVCRQLRTFSDCYVLMLTARADEVDKLIGLSVGADDYMTKPFSPRELVARVSAVLRRVRPALAGEALTYADLEMDTVGHKVRRSGEVIPLGPTEFRLLKHFLEHPGHVFSRERLLDSVWGHDSDIESRTVDVHIRRLRKAINEGGRPDIIRTVRSAGYALDAGH